MSAVDYSSARFTSAQLRAAGVVAVGRYLTGPYAITRAELDELVAGGIVVWFIFERDADDVRGGAVAGAEHAEQVNAALAALGLPPSQPVYFADDEDETDPEAAVPYFEGVAGVRSAATSGDYAEGAVCELLGSEGLTAYHWQSMSAGFAGNGATLSISAIQQEPSGAPLGDTDLDVILTADFGQYPRPGVPAADPPEVVAMVAFDPLTGGSWGCKADGSVYAFDGAPYLGGLNSHPEWNTEKVGTVAGIAAWKGDGAPTGGNGYVIYVETSTGFDLYRFPGDGSLRG